MARRYRDTVGPVGVETRFSDPGTVDFQSQLLQATRQVTDTAMSIAVPLAEAKGIREGRVAGSAGQGGPIAGLAAGSPYGRGYNSAHEATYVSKMQGDLKAKADEVERQYGDDPRGFQQAFTSITKAQLDNTPEEYQQAVRLITQGQYQDIAGRVAIRYQAKAGAVWRAAENEALPAVVSQAVTTAMSLPGEQGDAVLAAAVAERRAAWQVGVEQGFIDADDVPRLEENFRKLLDASFLEARVAPEITRLTAELQHDLPRSARKFAAFMESDAPPEVKEAVRKEYMAEVSTLQQERSLTHMDATASVVSRLSAGETSPSLRSEIERLRTLNVYTPSEYDSKMSALQNNLDANRKKAQDEVDFAPVLAAYAGLNTNVDWTKENREALDTFFQAEMANNNNPVGSEKYVQGMVVTLKRTSQIPRSAQVWMSGAIKGGNPEQAAKAAAAMKKLQEANPVAYGTGFDPESERFAKVLNIRLQGNTDLAEAYKRTDRDMHEMASQRWDRNQQKLGKEYDSEATDEMLRDLLASNDTFDQSLWPTGAPPPSLYLADAFRGVFMQELLSTNGNVEAATELASQAFATAGVTRVNGKPEVRFTTPKAAGYTDAMANAAKALALREAGLTGLNPDDVKLFEDEWTASTKGRDWGLVLVDDKRGETTLYAGDRPLRLVLPQDEASLQEVNRVEQAIAEAKFVADAERKRRAQERAVTGYGGALIAR